jgi:23S rRNA pseudouridine1911/1915/1917 synthase
MARKAKRRGAKRKPRRDPHGKEREFADLSKPGGDLELTVFEPDAGLRIDRFLAVRMPWRSRAQSVQLIEKGRVFLNGDVIRKVSKRVGHFDTVKILVPEDTDFIDAGTIPLEILYEDAHLIAINKQPGLVCHPAGKVRSGTLINALHARYRNLDDPYLDIVPRLCHRLDRDTSGLLLVAMNEQVRRKMQWIFEEKAVVKEYLAICEGHWVRDYDEVSLPLGLAGPDAKVRISMAVDEVNGAPSRTVVNVVERYPAWEGDRGFSLLRCSPVTGRQHQIRVHAAARGHALLGDSMYGAAPVEGFAWPEGENPPLLQRQALHAYRLQCPHPIVPCGELDVHAPPPDDLMKVVGRLRERNG